MRAARALLLACSIASPGCALIEDGTRNFCVAVCTPIEVHREKARNKQWAEEAWLQYCGQDAARSSSPDFAQGFKAGYAEYLFRGGDGEPPIVAPLHYRHYRYQTPAGYQAVQDWFDGYRAGAGIARDSGARRFVTVASSLEPRQAPMTPMDLTPGPNDVGSIPPPRFPMPKEPEGPPALPALIPVNQLDPLPEPVRLRIIDVRTAPETFEPEAPAEPPRLRIKGVTTSPPAGQ